MCFLGNSGKFIFHCRNSKLARNVFNKILMVLANVEYCDSYQIPRVSDLGQKSPKLSDLLLISHHFNVIWWTIPDFQLNSFDLENCPRRIDIESESSLNISMTCYILGHFTDILGISVGRVQFS